MRLGPENAFIQIILIIFQVDTIACADHTVAPSNTTGVRVTRREQGEVRGQPLRADSSLQSNFFSAFFYAETPLVAAHEENTPLIIRPGRFA